MFKLKYKELRDPNFRGTMIKLANCAEYKDYKVVYNIMRMAKTLEKELEKSQKEWLTLANTSIQKNEKGGFKVENDDFVYLETVDKEKAKKDVEAFGEKETVIERYKLNIADIAPAKLTPADLAAIEPIVSGLEVAPNP